MNMEMKYGNCQMNVIEWNEYWNHITVTQMSNGTWHYYFFSGEKQLANLASWDSNQVPRQLQYDDTTTALQVDHTLPSHKN